VTPETLSKEDVARMMRVLEGVELRGQMNTPDNDVIEHVRYAIRQGHPQIQMRNPQHDRIALVGSGPTLKDTEKELVALLHEGAKLVTTNGAYAWCLERNLRPSAQIVLDSRESTARFLQPEVSRCRYYAASQCHPSVWEALKGREFVGIFHAASPDGDSQIKTVPDEYYRGRWQGVPGGTTVMTRAIGLLRLMGYLRFDLFGVDCCWIGDEHHAFPQKENERDRKIRISITPTDETEGREFYCAPWMLKQLEDFLQMIRMMGDHFSLSVHGDGLLAYAIHRAAGASAQVTEGVA